MRILQRLRDYLINNNDWTLYPTFFYSPKREDAEQIIDGLLWGDPFELDVAIHRYVYDCDTQQDSDRYKSLNYVQIRF